MSDIVVYADPNELADKIAGQMKPQIDVSDKELKGTVTVEMTVGEAATVIQCLIMFERVDEEG